MTPFDVQCLIDINCLARPGESERNNSEAWKDFRRWAIAEGLIQQNTAKHLDRTWELTKRGHALLNHIRETPLPVQQWVRPEEYRG